MTYDSLLWQIRHFVYQRFADTTHPPNVDVTAAHFNISNEEVVEYYKELHNRHAFFLDLETLTIRMANPFSGIPTDFKVYANGKTYYANCAWDMLGIPAALHTDAIIEAVCTESKKAIRLVVKGEQITNVFTLLNPPLSAKLPQSDTLLVHFPLPFSRWYDDLVFT